MLPRNCWAILRIWGKSPSLGQEELVGSDSGKNPGGKGRGEGEEYKEASPAGVKGPEAQDPRVSSSLSPLSFLGPHHFNLRAHLKMSGSEEAGRKMALIGHKVPGALPTLFHWHLTATLQRNHYYPLCKEEVAEVSEGAVTWTDSYCKGIGSKDVFVSFLFYFIIF